MNCLQTRSRLLCDRVCARQHDCALLQQKRLEEIGLISRRWRKICFVSSIRQFESFSRHFLPVNKKIATTHPSFSHATPDILGPSDSLRVPEPSFAATCVMVAGLILTGVSVHGETAAGVARYAAIGCGLSLGLSLFFEAKKGTGNLLRADLVSMFALYFLLFFEFLFPQPRFDELVPFPEAVLPAIRVCLLAFAGIAVGRHCVSRRLQRWKFAEVDLSPGAMLTLFWVSVAIGYFDMLMSVGFNPITMVNEFMGPRFDAPWGRGKFGDFRA